ncbi:no individualized sperm [Carabus blaptoides fortunei]
MSRKEEALLMSLRHAVDMALGSPEVGAVNFNLLNAVLQVMIRESKLDEYSVQIRGPDVELLKMLSLTAHPSLSVKLTNYDISYNPWIDHKVSRQQKESFDLDIFGYKETKPITKTVSSTKPEELERKWKIVIVEPKSDIVRQEPDGIIGQPQVVIPITDDRFTELESQMHELKNQMKKIMDMPFVSDIIQIVQTIQEQNADHVPVLTQASDLWHNIKTNNRLDTIESGIEKLSNTLDAFMNEVTETLYVLSETNSNLETETLARDEEPERSESIVRAPRPSIFQNLMQRLDAIETRLDDFPNELLVARSNFLTVADFDKHNSETDISEQMNVLKKSLDTLEHLVIDAWKRLDHLSYCDEMYTELNMTKINLEKLEGEHESLKAGLKITLQEFADNVNARVADHCKYVEDLQALIGDIAQRTNDVYAHAFSIFNTDDEGVSLALLYKNVMKFREDARKLSKVTKEVIMGEKTRILMIEALLEQVEIVKTIKADKDDVEEALLNKPGYEYVNEAVVTKVSNKQLDEERKKIEDGFNKVRATFTTQEEAWLRALDEIRKDLNDTDGAVAELKPFQITVHKMFGQFEKSIRELQQARVEHETAVAKKNVMKNLDCIACDNPVYMKKENEHSLFPSPPTVSGKPTMKPLLTFDLESVRKRQHKIYECRSVKFTERNAPVRTGEKRARYYGGKHTITTAKERLPIEGHFFDQWRDRIKPLKETYMVGTDNKVYKSSESDDAKVLKGRNTGVQTTPVIEFSVKPCPTYTIPSAQRKPLKDVQKMQTSRHINRPVADQEAIEEQFIAKIDLSVTTEEESTLKETNSKLLSEESFYTTKAKDTTNESDLTCEEEETIYLTFMEGKDDEEDKTSDTVLQEQIKMKNVQQNLSVEQQETDIKTSAKDMRRSVESLLSKRFDEDSDLYINFQPKKRVILKDGVIDKDDLLPLMSSPLESSIITPEPDKEEEPLKSVLKKTSDTKSIAVTPSSSKRVRFIGSVSSNTGRRLGSASQIDKQ